MKALLSFFLLTAAAIAQPAARPDAVVTTAWLAQHANDSKLVIVHVTRMTGDDSYEQAHIAGAQVLREDKMAQVTGHPGAELLPLAQLKENFERLGLRDDSHVVAYAPDYDPLATRFLWTLDYIGFRGTASLLSGGLHNWQAEKRPITTEASPAPQSGKLTVTAHPEVLVKLDRINQLVSGAATNDVIIDSRMDHRYRDGHIPGAVDFYWQEMLVSPGDAMSNDPEKRAGKDRALRSPDELRAMFTRAGVTAGKRAVSYCEIGHQATFTYWIARYLGLDAAMYDGSFTEYSAAPGEKVVRGDQPR